MNEFALYPEEQHWWSYADYRCVLGVVRRLHAVRVLEFGPGSSTLALIEGGATHIDCCEDHPDWLATYRERLEARFPRFVRMHPYTWADPVRVRTIHGAHRYDLALIDGPNIDQRPAVIEYCLARSEWVLFPTEDHETAPSLRALAPEIAARHSRPLEIMDTGPLSGGFALLGPPC